jgi:hypothetical protein
VKGEQRTIGATTNTILVQRHGASAAYPMSALIKNPGPGTIYLGHHGLTSSTGFPLNADESLEVDIVNEDLYAITTTNTTAYILRRGD